MKATYTQIKANNENINMANLLSAVYPTYNQYVDNPGENSQFLSLKAQIQTGTVSELISVNCGIGHLKEFAESYGVKVINDNLKARLENILGG